MTERIAASNPRRITQSGSNGFVLAMLLIVYTFNFLDRQILGILAMPIKADLGLSDTQLGLLSGLAFVSLNVFMGIPLAWLADRTERILVVVVSLTLWSALTALCGIAGNFWQLCLCRMGVGMAEAGGISPSYAVIGQIYPPGRRAWALSVFSLAVPIGSAIGILIGGYLASLVDWRLAFLTVGAAGMIFAPILAMTVREPPRAPQTTSPPGIRAVLQTLAKKQSFWLLALGAASSSIPGYGLGFWLPSFLHRSGGMALVEAARFYSSLILVGGTAGLLLGGRIADRIGSSDRRVFAYLPAFGFLISAPLFALAILGQSVTAEWLLYVVPICLAYLWLGPVLTAIQHLVPPEMRATATASFLAINNLVGAGLGTLTVGALSDALTPSFSGEALKWALIFSLGFYLLAAILLFTAARSLRNEWVDQPA